jgi:hypothetical protein
MKVMLWLTAFIVILGAVLLFYSFRSKDIETPKYKVIKNIGEVQIRVYPSLILAQTKLQGQRYDSNGNNGFSTVAGYIFGGNQQQKKIAMTAPVIMSMSDSGASMSFVMPSQYEITDLPQPNSSSVFLVSQDSKTLAVLRFGGFASDEKIAKYSNQLTEVLQENKISVKSSLLFMGYNAPWDVVNRRNEVAYEVEYPN